MTIVKNNYFFSPASGYLNKYNEKGSIGPISYQFLQALSRVQKESSITALVFKSYNISSFNNVFILPLVPEAEMSELSSLKFYLKSFLQFINSQAYRQANVIHHFMPFTKDITFNLFFLFKDPHKKYILGPLIGTHLNTHLFNEDSSVLRKHNLVNHLKDLLIKITPYIFKNLSALTIKNADVVLFSDKYAQSCYQSLLNNNQTIKVLGVGIDTNVFNRNKNKPQTKSHNLNVLFVGRLTERKGCSYLIDAIAKVIKTNPNLNIHCTIAGSGVQDLELKELSKKLHLTKYISFTGGFSRDSEIVKHYQQSDVVCIPALSDTWVSAKQALSCGKPVIITDIGSHPEIVQDGINGYLVPTMDSAAIAEKLTQVASDSSLLKKLSDRAYILAQKRYNWKDIVNSYLSIVNSHARQ